jgi:hypothetical protein
MAERLLDGTAHEDDVPPGYRDVMRVLAAAASPSPVPSVEAAALAAFRSTRRPVDPPRRSSVIGKLFVAKVVAAAVLATAAVGTAAAAATGALPDAAQAKAHHIVAAVPDAEPAGHGTGSAAAATQTPKAGGASDHPALPGVAGLCQAYGAGNGGENGHRLDSTAFGRLADAAGGADKITGYCRTVTAAATPAAGDHTSVAGACRSWQAADRAGRAPAAPVLARLTAAAGGVAAIEPYCAALVGDDKGGRADKPSATPPAAPRGNAPTAPPGNDHGHGSPSHPAPPTPRG